MNEQPTNPKFTIKNVQVSTAKVEIQRLSLGDKEITIAVFRQFIEEPLVAADGSLNGIPWGIVNYHPDKCSNDPRHWHIVWQKGDELRRSQVTVTYEPEPLFWSETLAPLHAASVYQWLATGELPGRDSIFDLFGLDDSSECWQWVQDCGPREFTEKGTGIQTGYRLPEQVKAVLQAHSNVAIIRQTWEARKKWADLAVQNLEKARQEVSEATSRRGIWRARAPENHRQDCTCTECLRGDPRKAADHVGSAEERLEQATKQAEEYSPDSAKAQQAKAELNATLAALRSCYPAKSLNALRAACSRELKAEAKRRNCQVSARKGIAELPQLYIAA